MKRIISLYTPVACPLEHEQRSGRAIQFVARLPPVDWRGAPSERDFVPIVTVGRSRAKGLVAQLLDLGVTSFATDHPDVTLKAVRDYSAAAQP